MTDMPWGRVWEKTTGEIVVLCKDLASLKQAAQHFGLTREQLLELNGGHVSTTAWVTVRKAPPPPPGDQWWSEPRGSAESAAPTSLSAPVTSPGTPTIDPVVMKILRNAGREAKSR